MSQSKLARALFLKQQKNTNYETTKTLPDYNPNRYYVIL